MNDRIFELIENEKIRQNNCIDLIASENKVSADVLKAAGSILTNKYAEGYPGKRYYGGCKIIDEIEIEAQERCKQLFKCSFANVQPHSGSQANQSVFLALLQPGDTVLGMSLECGGHLTHGANKNLSGLWFNAKHYGVDKETGLIDYNEVRKIALECKPKLIIAGFSAYSRYINWDKFREIANEVGAYLMADIAHIAGFVATGIHPNPIELVDVMTSTTHKTLRGPRGGIVMTNSEDIYKKINSALFPGLQGGPLMHIIAAKAVAFQEALQSEFTNYMYSVIEHSQAMARTFMSAGLKVVSDWTDNHIVLLDLSSLGITGKIVESELESVGIICNKNTIPGETQSPFVTSGIRLGSAAMTTRGFKVKHFEEVSKLIIGALIQIKEKGSIENKDFFKSSINNLLQTI